MTIKMNQLFSGCDFSRGTEAFATSLLDQCLDALQATDGCEINDFELDMLAAAGVPSMLNQDITD